jgi:hypothetical protein
MSFSSLSTLFVKWRDSRYAYNSPYHTSRPWLARDEVREPRRMDW